MVSNEYDIISEIANSLLQDESSSFKNAYSISNEINWFVKVVNSRLDEYFPSQNTGAKGEEMKKDDSKDNFQNVLNAVPDLGDDNSVYSEFVKYYHLTAEERLLLMLALIPHVQPNLLDVFLIVNTQNNRLYTEFGGVASSNYTGFLPTGETALFLLAGKDLSKRFNVMNYFDSSHIFIAHGILLPLKARENNEPILSSTISLSDEYVDFFTKGTLRKPQFSTEFPAKLLTTEMNWEDLILDEHTTIQLDEIKIWLKHGSTLLNEWGMSGRIKPGYKALFHGPPGTGKTLTAALLGKTFELEVYRIDLSMVVSKYIGETEKNLERVFAKAENKNWILFFDEADALFGKRTAVQDSHDRYANQEISYLLQRLEDYPGLVILASNMRNNVDEAFMRRLQSVIYFKKPQAKERLHLWKKSFSPASCIPSDKELERLAQQYEISGGGIINVVHYASLMALNRNDLSIDLEDIITGIKKEYSKEGKTV